MEEAGGHENAFCAGQKVQRGGMGASERKGEAVRTVGTAITKFKVGTEDFGELDCGLAR